MALLRAYPRGRGGNAIGDRCIVDHGGLSPRARGKPAVAPRQAKRDGPIPAGAGETFARSMCFGIGGAYPRGRGGNRAACYRLARLAGLSPRARGKRIRDLTMDSSGGPIPAGAGETTALIAMPSSRRAYPRGRGGNMAAIVLPSRSRGLSPRARGKPRRASRQTRSCGPIPAGAGETLSVP